MSNKETDFHQNTTFEDEELFADHPKNGNSTKITDVSKTVEALSTPKRGPGRPSTIRTRLKSRLRKLYHKLHKSVKTTKKKHYAFLSEVPLQQAMPGPHREEWMQAMASEVRSIICNDTWEVGPRSTDRNVIKSRIVLRNFALTAPSKGEKHIS